MSSERRAAIATALRSAVPVGWTVYASPPPGGPAVPCAVVGPRSPYREMTTFQIETVHLAVTLLVPVTAGESALDVLDAAIDRVRPALMAVPEVAWERVEGVGTVTSQGGVEYVAGSIAISVA